MLFKSLLAKAWWQAVPAGHLHFNEHLTLSGRATPVVYFQVAVVSEPSSTTVTLVQPFFPEEGLVEAAAVV